eukprot:TRINITY_DN17979_c0_g1_i1.p2 TRINITY_DN17979_c0_g1~~TRINITY_DN17979_c0_g1_i1.p2  ORF type:complete len:104 (+),score=11.68 TRINITY_DN17979_c0_g1_i1:30-314(+)
MPLAVFSPECAPRDRGNRAFDDMSDRRPVGEDTGTPLANGSVTPREFQAGLPFMGGTPHFMGPPEAHPQPWGKTTMGPVEYLRSCASCCGLGSN